MPLQLIYQDIAWYLLYEYCNDGHLAIGRLNRFKNYCKVLSESGRGTEAQRHSLAKASQLLENGWGLNLGEAQEQQQELQGELELLTVKVRFFPPVTAFIQEGELRHLKQKIVLGSVDEITGKLSYVEYTVALPPRSLSEFSFWVYRYLDKAQVLSPPLLVKKHCQAAHALLKNYELRIINYELNVLVSGEMSLGVGMNGFCGNFRFPCPNFGRRGEGKSNASKKVYHPLQTNHLY